MRLLFTLSAVASSATLFGTKNRPVSKVMTLLKDMRQQLQKEQDADEAIYDKLACWCEKNDKDKTQAIKEAEEAVAMYTAQIESQTANSARLQSETEELAKEIVGNQKALSDATAIREKQLADFNAEQKDLLQSVQALKNAIVVLSKHHSHAELMSVAASVRRSVLVNDRLVDDRQKAVVDAALLAQAAGQAPATFRQQYAPQSGEIFGVLENMLRTFEENLSLAQQQEVSDSSAFEGLKKAKQSEIEAGQNLHDNKVAQGAEADEAVANAKQGLIDTRNNLSADSKFLMDVKLRCQQTDQEWESRQKQRQDEISAVSQALAVLSSDDSRDLFSKTFNNAGAFVQTTTTTSADSPAVRHVRSRVVTFLSAKQQRLPRLAVVTASARLNAFKKVKKAIDEMVTQLKQEQIDEVTHRDWCVTSLNENDKSTQTATRDRDDLQTGIEELTSRSAQLSDEMKALERAVEEMTKQIKRAGEDRTVQNAAFQETVSDQREMEKLLKQALHFLTDVYKHTGVQAAESALANTDLVQQRISQGPPAPAGFETYDQQGASAGVVGLLEQIISDAQAMQKSAIRDENDAQHAYESFVQDSSTSISLHRTDVRNKQSEKADVDGDKTDAESSLRALVNEVEQLHNSAADMHRSCDFTLKNFDVRQEARSEEIEALAQAKQILSGAGLQSVHV